MSSKVGGAYGGVGLVYDALWYIWASGDSGLKEFDHAYYAGSTDPTPSATTGVPLGVYRIQFTQGSPGTASQSKLPMPPGP